MYDSDRPTFIYNMEKNIMTKTDITAKSGKQEIIIVHKFNAPRKLVFKTFTDPKLYSQWIGLKGFKTDLETFEQKTGGSWRYIQIDNEGNEFTPKVSRVISNTIARLIITFIGEKACPAKPKAKPTSLPPENPPVNPPSNPPEKGPNPNNGPDRGTGNTTIPDTGKNEH